MPLRDFWTNVRTGARFVAPSAVADSPQLNTDSLERILRGAPIWLTPRAVDGYSPADFNFLTAAESQNLTKSVEEFRRVAGQVPVDQPATAEQIQQALPHFMNILDILRPDKYGDPEALELGKRVEQQVFDRLPPSVSELRFEAGEDANGGPALWIWVIFKDETVKDGDFLPNVRVVRQLLEQSVRQLDPERWPYVRFRTVSELEVPARRIQR